MTIPQLMAVVETHGRMRKEAALLEADVVCMGTAVSFCGRDGAKVKQDWERGIRKELD